MKGFAFSLLASLMLTSPLCAQDIVGSAVVDGQSVNLLDDGTWVYAEERTPPVVDPNLADCFSVTDSYKFCGKDIGWSISAPLSPDAAASFRLDDRNYGMVITESIGSDDGMTLEFMEQALISIAATRGGLSEDDVTVFSKSSVRVFELDSMQLVYGMKLDGLSVVFANTVLLREKETVQLITFTIGAEPTEEFIAKHTEYVSLVREVSQ